MISSYKFLVKPTPAQEQLLFDYLFASNQAYNHLVNYQLDFNKQYREAKEAGLKDEDLPEGKKASVLYHEIKDMLAKRDLRFNAVFTQQTVRQFLSQNFINIEKRKKGTQIGHLKFRNSRNMNGRTVKTLKNEYTLKESSAGNILRLFKEDFVYVKHRELPEGWDGSTVIILFENNRFYFIFSAEDGYNHEYTQEELKKMKLNSMGLDINNGSIDFGNEEIYEYYSTYKFRKNMERQIRKLPRIVKLQRKQSRRIEKAKETKTPLGANFYKTQKKLQKQKRKENNIKNDFRHKLTFNIVKFMRENNINHLIMEDLNVKQMTSKDNKPSYMSWGNALAMRKNMLNLGYSIIQEMLTYKCSKCPSENLIYVSKVNPRNTSKKCSCCGNIKEDLTLKHRRYECDKCGLIIRRDYNACLNIKAVWNEPLCEDR